MELRQLTFFTVLAETLNFHRAAERLNISQPPLSVAIVGLICLPLLEATDLDLAIIERDELVVALRANHPLARRDAIPLSALSAEPFILHTRLSVLHATVMRAAHDAGFVPHVAQEATQVSTLLSLVRSGLGVALVPSIAARQAPEDVRMVQLRSPVHIEAGIALLRDQPQRAALNFRALALSSDIIRVSN